MADDKEGKKEGAEEGEEPKPKKNKNMILIIIIAVAVIAGGTGAFFFFTKSGSKGGAQGEKGHGAEESKDSKESKKDEGVMVPLDPFVVNLSDQTGSRYLKVSLQLEVSGPLIVEKAKGRTAQLRDAIITLLTSKSSETLISPEGKLQLKDEINIMANQILGNNSVKNVYLTDFVMQ